MVIRPLGSQFWKSLFTCRDSREFRTNRGRYSGFPRRGDKIFARETTNWLFLVSLPLSSVYVSSLSFRLFLFSDPLGDSCCFLPTAEIADRPRFVRTSSWNYFSLSLSLSLVVSLHKGGGDKYRKIDRGVIRSTKSQESVYRGKYRHGKVRWLSVQQLLALNRMFSRVVGTGAKIGYPTKRKIARPVT